MRNKWVDYITREQLRETLEREAPFEKPKDIFCTHVDVLRIFAEAARLGRKQRHA